MFVDVKVDDYYAIVRKNTKSMLHHIRENANGFLKMMVDQFDSIVLSRYIELNVQHAILQLVY